MTEQMKTDLRRIRFELAKAFESLSTTTDRRTKTAVDTAYRISCRACAAAGLTTLRDDAARMKSARRN